MEEMSVVVIGLSGECLTNAKIHEIVFAMTGLINNILKHCLYLSATVSDLIC